MVAISYGCAFSGQRWQKVDFVVLKKSKTLVSQFWKSWTYLPLSHSLSGDNVLRVKGNWNNGYNLSIDWKIIPDVYNFIPGPDPLVYLWRLFRFTIFWPFCWNLSSLNDATHYLRRESCNLHKYTIFPYHFCWNFPTVLQT